MRLTVPAVGRRRSASRVKKASFHRTSRPRSSGYARSPLPTSRKHSGATEIDVELEFQPDDVCLTVRDNGNGYESNGEGPQRGQGGFGLIGMEQRVLLLRHHNVHPPFLYGDCGYAGLEVLPNGTFVATTYVCHRPLEANSVISVRFTLEELDERLRAR